MKRLSLLLLISALVAGFFATAPLSSPPKASAMTSAGASFNPLNLVLYGTDPADPCGLFGVFAFIQLNPQTDDDGFGNDFIGWVVRDGAGVVVDYWVGAVDVGYSNPSNPDNIFSAALLPGWVNAPTTRPILVEFYDIDGATLDSMFFGAGDTPETRGAISAIRASVPLALAELDPAALIPECNSLPLTGILGPSDGRRNPVVVEPGQAAAVYCLSDGSVDVFRIIDGKGVHAFTATPEEIAAVGSDPAENTIIDAGLEVRLYRLTSGEYQVNAPVLDQFTGVQDPNGYHFIWPGCGAPDNPRPQVAPPPLPVSGSGAAGVCKPPDPC